VKFFGVLLDVSPAKACRHRLAVHLAVVLAACLVQSPRLAGAILCMRHYRALHHWPRQFDLPRPTTDRLPHQL
jgi:hypothetical protein